MLTSSRTAARFTLAITSPSAPACARPLRLTLLMAALCGASVGAQASDGLVDGLHPFASVGYSYDDNLLRVPDGAVAFDNTRADSSRQIEAGVVFDKVYGRQEVNLQARVNKVSFSHFSSLDYDGKDLAASVGWHLGNHLEGNVGASYDQVLAPYTDFSSNERNLRTQRHEFVDGKWRFHPSWQLRAGVTRDAFSYDLVAQQFNDRTEDAYLGGIDYLASTNSSVGLQLSKTKGRYDNQRIFNKIVYNDNYTQDEVKLRVDWAVSPTTSVQFLGGWVRRDLEVNAARNASGTNGRVSASWAPVAKLNFSGSVWREFTSIESTQFSYGLNTGASVGATWALAPKVKLQGQYRYESRDFSALSPIGPQDIGDNYRNASAGASYQLFDHVLLSANVFHETRSGIAALGSAGYHANGASLNARAQF